MPWDEVFYPASMRHLSEVTRAKAIEIANALLAEGADSAAIRSRRSPGVVPVSCLNVRSAFRTSRSYGASQGA